MKPDLEMYVLTGLTALAYFIAFKYGLGMTIFVIIVYTFSFFLTSQGVCYDLVKMNDCKFYYKEYKQETSYSEVYSKLKDYYSLRKKLDFGNRFLPCGIFYNNPAKSKGKICKAAIGLIENPEYKKTITDNNKDKEKKLFAKAEEQLIKEGFTKKLFDDIELVWGWYTSFFSLIESFIFITKFIIGVTVQKYFSRVFFLKWKEKTVNKAKTFYSKKAVCMVTISDHTVNFYIPVENEGELILNN